jgi:predicted outer membrane repeat protein
MGFFPKASFAGFGSGTISNQKTCTVGGINPTNRTIQSALNSSCMQIDVRSGTYTENLRVRRSVTLNGSDPATTVINGSSSNRVINITNGSVTIKNLTIQNGAATGSSTDGQGAGIRSDSRLTIENVIFEDNEAASDGGALYVTNTTTITNSTFQNNRASRGGAIFAQFDSSSSTGILTLNTVTMTNNDVTDSGGALMVEYGGAMIDDSSFIENTAADVGGAIVASRGTFSMTNSTVSNNTAEGSRGGGLYIIADPSATIADSEFSDNSADSEGGGVFSGSSLTITDTIISGNTADAAGGVYFHIENPDYDTEGSDCTRCTITGNIASGSAGGGFVVGSESTVNFTDSTIAYNYAATYGGAVYIAIAGGDIGILNLSNVTVSTNEGGNGGGIYNKGTTTINNGTLFNNTSADLAYGNNLVNSATAGGPLTVNNTIVAGDSTDNCSGTITSSGYNLENGSTCALSAEGDISSTDPELGALADNGGTTETHRPASSTSPVVDMGDSSTCTTSDQTGAERRDGDGDSEVVCDIGAVEY